MNGTRASRGCALFLIVYIILAAGALLAGLWWLLDRSWGTW